MKMAAVLETVQQPKKNREKYKFIITSFSRKQFILPYPFLKHRCHESMNEDFVRSKSLVIEDNFIAD